MSSSFQEIPMYHIISARVEPYFSYLSDNPLSTGSREGNVCKYLKIHSPGIKDFVYSWSKYLVIAQNKMVYNEVIFVVNALDQITYGTYVRNRYAIYRKNGFAHVLSPYITADIRIIADIKRSTYLLGHKS